MTDETAAPIDADAAAASVAETPGEDTPLGPPGERALERAKEERKAALAELKAFQDLGLTPADIAALRESPAKSASEGDDAAAIEQRVREALTAEFENRIAASARTSTVRELAATAGFVNPKQVLRLLDTADLDKITVTDGVADEAAVKQILEALAKDSPYLISSSDSTVSARLAGIGASGTGVKPESKPGVDRMRSAYAATSSK